MKRLSPKLLMILVAIGSIALSSAPLAQEWVGLHNSMIEITYVPPRNPANMPTYISFKNLQVLEELSAFLSPLRLPTKLSIKMTECGVANLYYSHDQGVILCYEYPRSIWRFASQIRAPKGFTRRDVVVGTFVLSALHELGHAVFDVLQVPVFGRQEDAADQIAAFVILNFGKDFAQRNVNGAARYFRAIDRPLPRTAFSDEHGTWAQRFYNLICIAYGGQPEVFKNLVESGTLPKERAALCNREYDQVNFAFAATIWPHIDQELLKKVQSIEWAKWEGEIYEVSDLDRIQYVLGVIIVSSVVALVLSTAMSTSPMEFVRELMRFGVTSFRGRLDRIHWWAYMLTASVAAYVLTYVLGFFEVDFASPRSSRLAHAVLVWAISGLVYYWYAAFAIKRLHDRNKHAWLVVFWLAPLVFGTIIYAYPDAAQSPSFGGSYVISLFLWLWLFIELGFRRGTRGENRYGPETRYRTVK